MFCAMTPYWFNIGAPWGTSCSPPPPRRSRSWCPPSWCSVPISLSLYSRATSWIFACWWTSCLFITERLNGVGVRVTGDALPLGVPLLIMSNHKCNLDWMFLWSAAIRTGSMFQVGVFRAVAKSEIRVIPVFGWGCKLNGFAYVRRKLGPRRRAPHVLGARPDRPERPRLGAHLPGGHSIHGPEQAAKRRLRARGTARDARRRDSPAGPRAWPLVALLAEKS